MRTSTLALTLFSLSAAGLAACSSTPNTTTSGGTTTGGGTTTTGGTTGGSTTGGTTTGASTTTGGSTSTGGDAGVAGLGLPCNPAVAADPCTGYFLGCSQTALLADGGSTCQLPVEQAACDPTIGCADGTLKLHCVSGFGAGMNPNTCVFYCATTADCPTAVTSCQPGPSGTQQVCLFNLCGPGTASGGQYYGPCPSSGATDGTCDPLVRLTATSDLGICDQAGDVGLWQTCSFSRDPGGGATTLCAQNSTCVPYASPNGPRTFCAPVCNPAGSIATGPSCATGQTCFAFASPDFGICLTDCAGGQACPGSYVCQTLAVGTGTVKECVPN